MSDAVKAAPSAAKAELSPIEIRLALGLPRLTVAAESRTSEPTVKLYEFNRSGVTERTKKKLDPVYARMADKLRAEQGG
jgi:hypothetical protein